MKISRSQSIALALSTLGLFFALSFVLIYGRNEARREPAAGQQPAPAAQAPAAGGEVVAEGSSFVLNEFHRSEVKNGRKVWEVRAARGQYVPETQQATVEDATMWFFQKDGVVQLKARNASLALDGTALLRADIKNGVELTYNDKTTLTTESAVYDKEKNLVTAPGPVVIRQERNEISGKGLTADMTSQIFTLTENVETTLYAGGGSSKQ